MKRFLFVPLFAVALLLQPLTHAAAQDVLRPAAVVNDDVISLLDVTQRIQLAIVSTRRPNTPQVRRQMAREILRMLIDERLKIQEAERLDIDVSDAEVKGAVQRVASQNNMQPDQMLQGLRRQGVLPNTLYDQFRAEIAWQQVVRRRLLSSVDISEEEIDEVVAKIQQQGGDTQKRIFEIFLSVDTASEEGEIKRQAQEVLQTLRNGSQFSALARQVSQSSSASFGGDLGWLQVGQLSQELQKAVAGAPVGSIIGPIRTTSGFYILKIQDERKSRSEEKVHLKQFFFSLPPNPSFEQLQEAQSRAADAQRKFENCSSMDSLAEEIGDPGSGDMGVLKTSDLPGDTREVIEALDIGEASQPVEVNGGLAVIALCNRQESGGVDRLAIERKLTNDRLDTLARRYLLDLRRSSNIDIRL